MSTTQRQTQLRIVIAPPRVPLRRRWWQWTLRISLAILLLLSAAYVTLPWWLSGSWVRDFLARDLSRQMGVNVTIERVQLSWSEGVQIHQLAIPSVGGFGPEPLAVVGQLRADLSPLDLLLRKKIAWMEIDRPTLHVRIDRRGNSNLNTISRLSSDVETRLTSVRQATVILQLPDQPALRFSVASLELLSGRVQRIGRLTMSATLEQSLTSAPVSLRLWTQNNGPTMADASFNFNNVQLEQLQLPRLLGLGLKKLAGQCAGKVDLKMNALGVVDHFDLSFNINNLDVQGLSGPHLPVVEQAAISASARFDPLTERIDVESARITLPGIDLAGKGSWTADIEDGTPEAIGSIDLAGKVYPSKLAALITGRPILPGGYDIQGPLDVRFTARRQQERLAMNIAVDGTTAALRKGTQILKPADRPLRWELDGVLDERGWNLNAQRALLVLGDNRFHGRGTVRDVKRLLEQLSLDLGPNSFAELRRDIQCVQWKGDWEIQDLPSLRQALPDLPVQLQPMELKGALTGQMGINSQGPNRLTLLLMVPAQTRLALGGFSKPADQPMQLNLNATMEDQGIALKDLELHLSLGSAMFRAFDGSLRLGAAPGPSTPAPAIAAKPMLNLEASARFRLQQVETLLKAVPALQRPQLDLSGAADGRADLRMEGPILRAHAWAELTGLALRNCAFSKAAGQTATVDLDFLHDASISTEDSNRLTVDAQLGFADLRVVANSTRLWKDADCHLNARLRVTDARSLLQASPSLGQSLGDAKLAGAAQADFWGKWTPDKANLELRLDADNLAFALPGGSEKAAKVPLRMRLTGALNRDDNAMVAQIDTVALDLADNHFQLDGQVTVGWSPIASFLIFHLPIMKPVLQGLQADVRLTGVVNEDACKLLPPLRDLAKTYGLSGAAVATARLDCTQTRLTAHGQINADKFAIGRLGPVCKPVDLTTRLEAQIAVPVNLSKATIDFSNIAVRNLALTVGQSGLLAEGGNSKSNPASTDAHLSLWTHDAGELRKLVPQLAPHNLSGSAHLELELQKAPALSVPLAEFSAQQLKGRLNGKDLLLDGKIRLSGLREDPKNWGHADSVATDDAMEFRIGENHGWLFVDLQDVPGKTRGTAKVMAEYLEDKGLSDWVDSLSPTKPTSRPATLPVSLEQQAAGIIARLRPLLADSNFSVSLSSDRFHTFDANVQEYYDIQFLQLDAQVDRGQFSVQYSTGLNGGTVARKYHANLNDMVPILTFESATNQVAATKSLQPQLALYFPGNIVSGLFTRNERLTMSLRDVIANSIDSRYPLYPSGEATTVTTDGYVEGQAAPKWLTRFFPGLNLTRYKYDTMTAFATFKSDGSADNDMIFSGSSYDVYMEGSTAIDHWGTYEIGLILGGSPQWNHTWKQGRIPIMKFKGRIEGGKIHDQTVEYLWPNETLFKIFLERNVVYRMWLNHQRQ